MKKYPILIASCFGISIFALSQSVGIGTTVPNGSAQLDVASTSKGILIPRMNTAAITAISNPGKGLMVYDSSKNQLMVNMGTATIPNWQTIVSKSGWNLIGNTGTNPATNFIGTTDASPLIMKVKNVRAGFIDTGTNNTSLGFRTLDSVTTGTYNLGLGYKALLSNSSGVDNTAVGANTLPGNTTGSYNTASGTGSLQQNSTGDLNSAYGAFSLNRNIVGVKNTAIGTSSLYWNIGNYNTGLGFESLNQNSTGTGNTALGTSALWNNYIGYSNVAVGVGALYHNTDRSNLVAVGDSSLFNNGVGASIDYYAISNTAIGSKALFSNTTGDGNTANGFQALFSNTSGRFNTGIGYFTLHGTNASYSNTAVGYFAGGGHNLGYNNTLIGAYCQVLAEGMYNCVGIGEGVICTANSEARIGNSSTNSIGGYANWTNFSDGRYKKNVQENVKGTDFIMKLRPVTYQLDVQGIRNKLNESRGREIDPQTKQSIAEKEKMVFSGFVAQEVEIAAKESGYDFSGVDAPKNENDFYGLRYGDFVVPLVKTVQEQQAIINDLQSKVQSLEKQAIIDKQSNNAVQQRLQSLEEQVKLLLQASDHKN